MSEVHLYRLHIQGEELLYKLRIHGGEKRQTPLNIQHSGSNVTRGGLVLA